MSIRAPTPAIDIERTLPSPAVRWWLLGVLFFTAIVSYSDRLILSMLVDPLRADLGLSDPQVGLLQGPAFTVVYVFTALPLGYLADRYNRRWLLFAGSTLWCTATLLCGFAPSAGVFLVGRLLLGVGEAALVPTALSMLGDSFPPERRGMALGVFLLASVVGGPFGITLGGFLLSLAQSGSFAGWPLIGALAPWRAVLAATGVVGLLSPLLILTLREPRRGAAQATMDFAATRRYFLSDRRLLIPLYAGLAMLSIEDYGLVNWVPTTLERLYAWTPARVGVAFGIITSAAGIAGVLLGGWIADLAAQRGGNRVRLVVSMTGALLAVTAALAVSQGHAGRAVRSRILDSGGHHRRGDRRRGDSGSGAAPVSRHRLCDVHVHEYARGFGQRTAAHRGGDRICVSFADRDRPCHQRRRCRCRPRGVRIILGDAPRLGAPALGRATICPTICPTIYASLGPAISAANVSAIASTAACTGPDVMLGITDASTTCRPSRPRTLSSASTTASPVLPMRQVPTG